MGVDRLLFEDLRGLKPLREKVHIGLRASPRRRRHACRIEPCIGNLGKNLCKEPARRACCRASAPASLICEAHGRSTCLPISVKGDSAFSGIVSQL